MADDDLMSVTGTSLSNSDNEDGLMDRSELEQEYNSDDDNESMQLHDDGDSQTQSVSSDTGPSASRLRAFP